MKNKNIFVGKVADFTTVFYIKKNCFSFLLSAANPTTSIVKTKNIKVKVKTCM